MNSNHLISQAREHFKVTLWAPVQRALQVHLANRPKGEASRLAYFLGVSKSQVHRWSCPVCEHNQEPKFSIGLAIILYLQNEQVTIDLPKGKSVPKQRAASASHESLRRKRAKAKSKIK